MTPRKAVFSVDVEYCYPGGDLGAYTYMEVFRELDIRATFFVTGDVAEGNPKLVEDILAAGHEVGSHGWRHPTIADPLERRGRFLTELDSAELEDHLGQSKSTLSKLGANPVGFRAIQFIANRAVFECAGRYFDYDSSLFDGESRHLLPDGLKELPVATFRFTSMKIGTPIMFGPVFPIPRRFLYLATRSDPAVMYGHSFDFTACNTPLFTSAFKRFWYFKRCGPQRKSTLRTMLLGFLESGTEFVTGHEAQRFIS